METTKIDPVAAKPWMPWREVFALPEIGFGTAHGFTRAVEAGRIEAEFSIETEIEARRNDDRYYDSTKLPERSAVTGWLSYEDATKLLAQGSHFPKEEIGDQQMANLLEADRIDARVTRVSMNYDPDTEMLVEEAVNIIDRVTLRNCMATGEIRKRYAGKYNVVNRDDVESVARVLEEYVSRSEAAQMLGLTQEAVRRWVMRHPNVTTRPAPGLPKKDLILRADIEAKAAGTVIGETADVWLTPSEFSDQTNIPISRVKQALRAGDLPGQTINRNWLINPDNSEVQAWVAGQQPTMPPGTWMTMVEAANMLHIDSALLTAWCREGKVPSARKVKGIGGQGAGGKWMIEGADVVALSADPNTYRTPTGRPRSILKKYTPSKTPTKRQTTAELMPDDFTPLRSVRSNPHPAWALAKENPNRWVKVDLKEQTVRSEASTRNGKRADLPGLWSVSRQGNEVFISLQVPVKKTL